MIKIQGRKSVCREKDAPIPKLQSRRKIKIKINTRINPQPNITKNLILKKLKGHNPKTKFPIQHPKKRKKYY